MIRELARIANKLDSIGLTKDADLIDSEILKLANDDDIDFFALLEAEPSTTPSKPDETQNKEESLIPSSDEEEIAEPTLNPAQSEYADRLIEMIVKNKFFKNSLGILSSNEKDRLIEDCFIPNLDENGEPLDPEKLSSCIKKTLSIIERKRKHLSPDTIYDISPGRYYFLQLIDKAGKAEKKSWVVKNSFLSVDEAGKYAKSNGIEDYIVMVGSDLKKSIIGKKEHKGYSFLLGGDQMKVDFSPDVSEVMQNGNQTPRHKGME